MRTWRVGTLSMGVTLVGLGAALLGSQFQGLAAFDTFVAWWPILLILLGLEVLLYLFFQRKGEQRVHYDFLSMLFVGVLFSGCLAFTFLTSLGVVGEVRGMLQQVETTSSLPVLQEVLPSEVKKVIVQTTGRPPKVDRSPERSVHAFGTYRQMLKAGDGGSQLSREAVYEVKQVGETLYILIKSLPRERGIRAYYPDMNVTVVLPGDLQAEVRGPGNEPIQL